MRDEPGRRAHEVPRLGAEVEAELQLRDAPVATAPPRASSPRWSGRRAGRTGTVRYRPSAGAPRSPVSQTCYRRGTPIDSARFRHDRPLDSVRVAWRTRASWRCRPPPAPGWRRWPGRRRRPLSLRFGRPPQEAPEEAIDHAPQGLRAAEELVGPVGQTSRREAASTATRHGTARRLTPSSAPSASPSARTPSPPPPAAAA